MNRRIFAVAASCTLVFASASSIAEAQGVRIRFVITRASRGQDGRENRSSYEDAILVAPNEGFKADFTKEYRLALRPVPGSDGIRIEAILVDLALYPATQMSGAALIQMGQGGAIIFQGPESESYALGLLVTAQQLPKSAA